jgi:hypothetical protein
MDKALIQIDKVSICINALPIFNNKVLKIGKALIQMDKPESEIPY